jgi:predicted MPP superfamily phosphohydrolase
MDTRLLAAAGLALAGVGFAWHSIVVAPRSLRLHHRDVFVPRLPAAFDGYRIAHLSDLHLGALTSGAKHVRTAAAVLQPDLCVVTGDLIDRDTATAACAALLGSWHVLDGVIGILGNHEHYALRHRPASVSAFIAQLAARGVRTLVNESLALERDGQRLWVVGVDDPYRHRDHLTRAFAGVPAHEPSILLAHAPDILLRLPAGRTDLVLTGHCHGGQVRTPWGPIVTRTRMRLPDVLGLQWVNGVPVHLSGGMGSTIPLRVLCPPEVTVLQLRAGPH